MTPTGVGSCPSTRKEGPLATVRAAGTPEGQGALVCVQGCTWSQVCGAGPQGTHSCTRHVLLPGPFLVALSRAVRATHHNHVGSGVAYHPLRSRDPGRQCREGEAQTEGGGDLGGCVSGQAWRGKGELLSAQGPAQGNPEGLGRGAE